MGTLETINIISFNCNGLGDFRKRKDVFDFLRKENANIYLIQETHWNETNENVIRSLWGFDCFVAGNNSNSKGVAILFNNNFEYKIHNTTKDKEGRYILLDIELLDKRITLVNIYAPSAGDHPEFFESLFNNIIDYDNNDMIIAGDWNIALDPKLDSNHPSNIYKVKSRQVLSSFMNSNNVIDIFRILHGSARKYTWKRFNGTQRSRIDYFLISDNLTQIVQDSDIRLGYLSDHSIIRLCLKTDKTKRHRPFWKFNNSLLRDIDFVKIIKQVIKEVKNQYAALVYDRENINLIEDDQLTLTIDDQLFLEILLLEIRGKCISYSSYKRKELNKKEEQLINELKILEQQEEDINLIEEKKRELFIIRQKKLDGMIIRSKAKWIQDGEKNSRYFCNLEKRYYTDKYMNVLEQSNGEIICDIDQITNEVKTFYQSLYASKENEIKVDIDPNLVCPKLDEDEKNSLEGLIKLTEILNAIKNLKNDKSPGSDGYTAEFFKFFYKDLGIFIMRSINSGFKKGEMSITQRQGIITCIPKEGKEKRFIQNWRPITVLNNIYKIAASCIAGRIKTVLPKLIHEDQKGFVKGRFIGDNIRLMYDAIFYSELHNVPGLLLTIDFEKAFDCVAWSFIEKTLVKFNFGSDILRWISTFYCKITSCISINGQYSSWFNIHRGTRQGDPLSPYLFILCAEILSNMIRQNDRINGLRLKDIPILLSQFADDTAIFLDGSQDSFLECMHMLNVFTKMSGLKINYDKCCAIWLGKCKGSKVKYNTDLNIAWNPEKFKYLGVYFCTNIDKITTINFEGKLNDINNLLIMWSRRKLTPFGKITIIKSLAVSKITHLLLTLPDPKEEFLNELSTMFFKFLWSDKNDKIKREVIIQSYELGGLKMLDVKCFLSSLKISCLQRILTNEGKLTQLLLSECLSFSGIKKKGSEFLNILMTEIKNPFWVDVLKHLKKLWYHCKPETFNDFASECIFYNKHITRDGKVVNIRNWSDKGIYRVGQLLNEGVFLSLDQFKQRYNICVDFLTYEGIIKAIKCFQNKLGLEAEKDFILGDSIVWKIVSTGLPKNIYTCLIKKDLVLNCIAKWSLSCASAISKKHIFLKITKITRDTNLKWFQYRLIHRLLPTQRFLYLRKITNSPICTFCNKEEQTIEHLFWDCNITNNYWSQIEVWMKSSFPNCVNLNFSKQSILLGYADNSKTDKVIDLLILLAKFHIYVSKMNSSMPNLPTFINTAKQRFNVEKYIAYRTNTYKEFVASWTPYKTIFQINQQ